METSSISTLAIKSYVDAAAHAQCSDKEHVVKLVQKAQKVKSSLIDAILDEGIVNEDAFLHFISEQFGLVWHQNGAEPEEEIDLKSHCSAALAIRYQVVPVAYEDGLLTLACYDPFSLGMRQVLTRAISDRISFVMDSRRNVRGMLSSMYGVGADTFEKILEGRDLDIESLVDGEEASVIDEGDSDEASVLRFVNQIIREALTQKATDIHVEPQKSGMCIRYRVDGQLLDVPVPESINALQDSVVARLKICLLYTSPSPRDLSTSRMPSSA